MFTIIDCGDWFVDLFQSLLILERQTFSIINIFEKGIFLLMILNNNKR